MYVQLLTKDRKLVARYSIAEFNPGPEILTWGSRAFTRADDQLLDLQDSFGTLREKQRVTNYVEGLNYFLLPTHPTWEAVEEGFFK